ncbi:MAG: hypothetical protein Q7T63_21495 [Burkholderiaceae bacterium]|nr:hypothetical protein [Burkholderiaceae bacterium]
MIQIQTNPLARFSAVARTSTPTRALSRCPANHITQEDWGYLFRAVVTTLEDAARVAPDNDASALRATALRCAQALEQLHAALKDARAHER